MSETRSIRFINSTATNRNAHAKSAHLSGADQRHVRLATLRNAKHQHHPQKLRKQKEYESTFLITTPRVEGTESSSKRNAEGQPLSYPRLRQSKDQRRDSWNTAPAQIDRAVLKSGTSLDQSTPTPHLAHDLNFLRYVLETNTDYALLSAAYQHEALLYGLLAMTTVYQDSSQGKRASSRSLTYHNKTIKSIIPLLEQKNDVLMDIQVAAVVALATIDLLETREHLFQVNSFVHEKGLRAILNAQKRASSVSGRDGYPSETALSQATEWILLMFFILTSGYEKSLSGGESYLLEPDADIEHIAFIEVRQIFRDISSISEAADNAISSAIPLQFSLGNSAATADLGTRLSKIERSAVTLPLLATSDCDTRYMLEATKFVVVLYLSIYIRHIPRTAAVNNILAHKALEALEPLLTQAAEAYSEVLCVHKEFSLFLFSILSHYFSATIFIKSERHETMMLKLQKGFSLACINNAVDTAESLLSIIQILTRPTTRACADIKDSFEIFLKKPNRA